MAARAKSPTRPQKATVRRFPATERGRRTLRARLANERYALPPSDGSVAEWRSWNGVTLQCGVCRQVSYPQMRLVLNLGGYYGAYTLWTPCSQCGHLDEELASPREKIIALGQRLDGWSQVTGGQSLLEQRRRQQDDLQAQRQRRRAMTPNYGRGGGDRGA